MTVITHVFIILQFIARCVLYQSFNHKNKHVSITLQFIVLDNGMPGKSMISYMQQWATYIGKGEGKP